MRILKQPSKRRKRKKKNLQNRLWIKSLHSIRMSGNSNLFRSAGHKFRMFAKVNNRRNKSLAILRFANFIWTSIFEWVFLVLRCLPFWRVWNRAENKFQKAFGAFCSQLLKHGISGFFLVQAAQIGLKVLWLDRAWYVYGSRMVIIIFFYLAIFLFFLK